MKATKLTTTILLFAIMVHGPLESTASEKPLLASKRPLITVHGLDAVRFEYHGAITPAFMTPLAALNTLRDLDLWKASFSNATRLDRLAKLKKLKMLRLSDVTFSAAHVRLCDADLLQLAKEMAATNCLLELYLNHTDITDAGLNSLKRFNRLEVIYLFNEPAKAQITVAGLATLSALENLTVLAVTLRSAGGRNRMDWAKFRHVKGLYLTGSTIDCKTLEDIANMPELEVLGLNDVTITCKKKKEQWSYFAPLTQCKSLRSIHLNGTKVAGASMEQSIANPVNVNTVKFLLNGLHKEWLVLGPTVVADEPSAFGF